MRHRSWILIAALVVPFFLQAGPPAASPDPLAAPAELQSWVRQVTFHADSTRGKVQAILDATFRTPEDHGLGMVYDNTHTRTVQEVWKERKANCLGLTAFMVAACKSMGLEARFAEPVNLNHWKREGQLIRLERHLVALISVAPMGDVVADFLPQLRQRQGTYIVDTLHESRVRALFHSNRAVELMVEGDLEGAAESSRVAVQTDPTASAAWNIQGVVQRALKQDALAEVSYRKAFALDPKDGAPIGNLEQLLKDLGRAGEAAQFRVLALETRKRDPYFNAFLAQEASREGRLADALDLIHTAIKLLPYDSELYLAEAQFRLEQGKPKEARKSLEKARRWAQPQERERYDSKLALLAKL